ncbi:MAG: hypothetical protein JSR85_07745 [Proteobacteria bacterium]|nr:hypothetical protein [Pseudomonadota bacterium]
MNTFPRKFNRLSYILLMIISLAFDLNYVHAMECEIIEVDRRYPAHIASFKPSYVRRLTQEEMERRKVSETKAKGIVGEKLSRFVIESDIRLGDQKLVSMFTYFENMGCNITPYLRSNADQGIDDVFVVLTKDGRINRSYNPLFHEAKYNGSCNLRLSTTKTICDQLSFQWIEHNLKKAHKRIITGGDICFGTRNGAKITPCFSCKTQFQEEFSWLASKLNAGHFHRTASVLCADGQLKIYNVEGR